MAFLGPRVCCVAVESRRSRGDWGAGGRMAGAGWSGSDLGKRWRFGATGRWLVDFLRLFAAGEGKPISVWG